MKILSITAQKPHSTGSGTYLTELVRSWDSAGHTQAVVCRIYPDDSISFPEGVTCCPVYFSKKSSAESGTPALPFPVVGMSDIMPYDSTLYRDLTPSMISLFEEVFISAVSRAVSDLDPDLIVCHHLFLLTALVRKAFPDRRIAGISHGTDLRQMMNCDNLRDIVRPEIAKLDMLLALHEEQKHQIADIFGVSESRVTVVGSGYSSKVFNTEGRIPYGSRRQYDAVRICYAGKMSRPKGVPELLRVLKQLSQEPDTPAFDVTLAGGCQDETVLEMLGDLPENITWLGQIPQSVLAGLFRSGDIFVLPSYFEGLPLVLIEAMASGMIPVSTDLPGVRPWVGANVPHQNIRFIPMPEMASIDCPTEAGRDRFVHDLHDTLKQVISDIASGIIPAEKPDTLGITWDSVAAKVLLADMNRQDEKRR